MMLQNPLRAVSSGKIRWDPTAINAAPHTPLRSNAIGLARPLNILRAKQTRAAVVPRERSRASRTLSASRSGTPLTPAAFSLHVQWLRHRRAAERLAQADAWALIRDHGGYAYGEARARECDVVLPNGTTHAGRTPAHWGRVALIVAMRTGASVGLDNLTRMLES